MILQNGDRVLHGGVVILTADVKLRLQRLGILVFRPYLNDNSSVVHHKAHAGVNVEHNDGVLRHGKLTTVGAERKLRLLNVARTAEHGCGAEGNERNARRKRSPVYALLFLLCGSIHFFVKLVNILIVHRAYISQEIFTFHRGIPSFIKCFFSLFLIRNSIVVTFDEDIPFISAMESIGSIIQ